MMRQALYIMVLILGTVSTRLHAQIEDKLQFHFGGAYDFLRIQGSPGMIFANYFTITGGGYYTFWQSNDVVSLSVNPNASLGISFNNLTGFSVFTQVPAYVMLRTGAACTKYNEQKFGAGVGVGLNYTYVKERAFIFGNTFYTLENSLFNPVAAAQLTFQNDFRTLTVRGYGSLLSYMAPFIEPYGNEKFNYDGYGLAILYNF